MHFPRIVFAATAAAVACAAFAAAELAPDTPLITDGPIVVDRTDFDAILLRIPEEYRAEVRMSPERVSTLIDSVYVQRVLAAKARDDGMDKDPAVQKRMQQAQEQVLAEMYRQKVEKDTPTPATFEQHAREIYATDKAKFTVPEQFEVQQVLIGLKGRTREQALERARKVYQEATGGKDEFLAYALKYSDEEQQRDRMRGELGWVLADRLVKPVRDALAHMKKGEISQPVESEYGFHVLKLIGREPARIPSFDEVKPKLIAAERERLKKARVEAMLEKVRSSPTVVVHKANVDALLIPVDLERVRKAQRDAAEAPPK